MEPVVLHRSPGVDQEAACKREARMPSNQHFPTRRAAIAQVMLPVKACGEHCIRKRETAGLYQVPAGAEAINRPPISSASRLRQAPLLLHFLHSRSRST